MFSSEPLHECIVLGFSNGSLSNAVLSCCRQIKITEQMCMTFILGHFKQLNLQQIILERGFCTVMQLTTFMLGWRQLIPSMNQVQYHECCFLTTHWDYNYSEKGQAKKKQNTRFSTAGVGRWKLLHTLMSQQYLFPGRGQTHVLSSFKTM